MKHLRLTIGFQTRSKVRPRFNPRNKRTYMPADYVEDRKYLAGKLRTATNIRWGPGEPVMLRVWFHRNHRRADIDNLVGFIMECLQDAGILHDDYQVTQVMAWRLEDEEQRTTVEVMDALPVPEDFKAEELEIPQYGEPESPEPWGQEPEVLDYEEDI